MWEPSLPGTEFVIRAIVVYTFLLVLLRVTGKRQVGQLSPFDFVLLLILSNAVQNSMNGGDNSITGGLILAATLVLMNWLVGYLTYKSRTLEVVIEGRPIIIVHDGKVLQDALRSVSMTEEELLGALRAQGCENPNQVRLAIIENNGHVSVIKKE